MPTVAQRERMQNMRDYFRQNYAGKVKDPNEARKDMQSKFPWITDHRWYNIRVMLKQINQPYVGRVSDPQSLIPANEQPAESDQGMLVQELEIPANLEPDARAAINKLLEINNNITQDNALKEVEVASLRGNLAALQARNRLLKKIVFETVEAL